MRIGAKLNLVTALLGGLIVVCGAAGAAGISSVSSTLRYVAGPAWDAADGAMEGSIGIEGQMLALARYTSPRVLAPDDPRRVASVEVDKRARDFGRPALERCLANPLFTDPQRQELRRSVEAHDVAAKASTQAFDRAAEAHRALRQCLTELEAVLEVLPATDDAAARADARLSGLRVALLLERSGYAELTGAAAELPGAARGLARDLERVAASCPASSTIPRGPGVGRAEGTAAPGYLRAVADRVEGLAADFAAAHEAERRARDTYDGLASALLSCLSELEEVGDSKVENEVPRIDGVLQTAYGTIGAAIFTSLVLGLFVGWRVSRDVTERVHGLRRGIEQVRRGDLAHELQGAHQADEVDDLRADVNALVAALREFAATAATAAGTLEASTREMLGATAELSAGYQEQRAAITDTVSTLDEFRTSIVSGRDRAEEVLDQARRTDAVASQGSVAVSRVLESMSTIRSQVENIAARVLALNDQSQRIGEIIDTVNAIADQSKLLALNAAIEAAKAGEYGRGFAVVAAEVGKLADRSQAATGEVRTILKEIQRAVQASVMATEEGSKSVDGGVTCVAGARETIETLATTIRSTSEAVGHIALASQEQTQGVNQIAELMRGIQGAVGTGTGRAAAIEGVAKGLTAQATGLRTAVSRFQGARS